jgi:hypothetical protein
VKEHRRLESNHEYKHPDHLKFANDMEDAGLDVQHYRGRFFWHGPAVVVDDLQDALGITEISCQWDNMGRGWVVYPRAYDHDATDPCDPA